MGTAGNIHFRQAVPEDAERVLKIKQSAIQSASDAYDDEEIEAWMPDEEAQPAFEKAMDDDQFVVLLAETGEGDIAGYGVLHIEGGRIDAVFVDPEYSGEGLGGSLVKQLERRAEMCGLSELEIVSSLNALGFYESLGYESVEDRTRNIDGEDLDFVAVEKSL